MTLFVLTHSPLVGPMTWSLVAEELRRRGEGVVRPVLTTDPAGEPPYWRQHVAQVARAVARVGDQPLVLVGHSGAGPLLPAIGQAVGQPVSTYLFVDANIPSDGASRLDLLGRPADAEAFRASAHRGLLPTWNEEDLREVLPDPCLRREFVAELRPLPLAVYEEALPVPEAWPDAPCGYIQLSAGYLAAGRQARQAGWAYYRLMGGHFHMLVEPAAVADALQCLGQDLAALAA